MIEEPRVHMRHVRQQGWCASGARAWCAQNGIEWLQLVRDGVPCSQAEATGDHFAITAAAAAREEAAHEQR